MAQNGKFGSLKNDPKFRELNNLLQKEAAGKHSSLLKTFNINSKNADCKPEYFAQLMAELKTFNQVKGKDSERSCEKANFEEEPRFTECNVQTVIRPQVTNPRTFWSKSEDEDFSSDGRNVKGTVLEEKVITNVFKPIRSGTSEAPRIKSVKSRDKIQEATGKMEKSIHESLRIQKVKRRTRLPSSWDTQPSQESCVKAYDPNYYSSLMKGINQEGIDYYSSNRKNTTESNYPVKSASDEQIYGEKQGNGGGYMEVKHPGSKSERISVTEPSSPLNGDYMMEVNKKDQSSDSEMDSESTGSEIVSEMKKSKSFIEKKEAEGYFSSKPRCKTSTLEIRHYNQSSSSSCDSAQRTRSLQKITKSKRKYEPRESSKVEYYSSKNQSYPSQSNKRSGKTEKEEMRRASDFGVVRKEKSWDRDPKTAEALQRINPDVFQHLIDVLLQKNRAEFPTSEQQKEFFTKSLPRNISRRLKDERSGKETLKVIKSALQHESHGKELQCKFVSKANEDTRQIFCNPGEEGDPSQRRKLSRLELKNGHQHLTGGKSKNEKSSEGISEKGAVRDRSGNNRKQCVFKIEDKRLWFEICKAVERVDAKDRNSKKYS